MYYSKIATSSRTTIRTGVSAFFSFFPTCLYSLGNIGGNFSVLSSEFSDYSTRVMDVSYACVTTHT